MAAFTVLGWELRVQWERGGGGGEGEGGLGGQIVVEGKLIAR